VNVETLIENATDEELPAIAAAMRRAQAKPCVLVTVQEGRGTRRYVVDREDEEQLRVLIGVPVEELRIGHYWFGAQWLRGMGRVDEMHRSLGLYSVVKIAEADRARVWGS